MSLIDAPDKTRNARLYAFGTFMTGGHPLDYTRNALAIRAAREVGLESVVTEIILAKRRESLIWFTRTQRDWQTKVSRRPARGRHHDSWSIRERYVRCTP